MIGGAFLLALAPCFAPGPSEQVPLQLFWEAREKPADSALQGVVTKLKEVAAARDAEGLIALMEEKVLVGMERGAVARQKAPEILGLDEDEGLRWRLLAAAAQVGGALNGPTRYVMPFFVEGPDVRLAPDWCLATEAAVQVRTKPQAGSPPIALLNHHVAQFRRADELGWLRIDLPDGRTGFTEQHQCISGEAARIYVERNRDGQWRLTGVVIGY